MMTSVTKSLAQGKKTPEPASITARKPSSSSIASIGSVTQSKLRLLSNNRCLAFLLNKKKMENRTLRDSNSKLSVSLSQYKHAYRNLQHRLEATNTTVRSLQIAAPIITKDIQSLFNRFEKMGNVLSKVNVGDIENQSFINNLSLADISQKPKPLRKRRIVNKVRPMKYGLVLGNPVVSLHRLGPLNTMASISQQSESDGFSTDTENDNNDEGLLDAATDVETASGQQSRNSPVPSNTSVALGSPMQPHPVAELTLSVPVLQSMGTAIASPNMRIRHSDSTTPSHNMMKQQELQLKTPCRVLIENLKHNQSASANDSDLSSSKSPIDNVSKRKKKRVKRAAQLRKDQSDVETPPTVKKMSDEELKKMLTPLQVEIKLPRIGLTDYSVGDSEPKRTGMRKSFPTRTLFDVAFSDDDSDRDATTARREKITSEDENQVPFPTVTIRNRARKHRDSPQRSSSMLKVKIINYKTLNGTKKVVDSAEIKETDKGKSVKKRVIPLKRKMDDTDKTDSVEIKAKVVKPQKSETDNKGTEKEDAHMEKQSSAPSQSVSNWVDDLMRCEMEIEDNSPEEPLKNLNVCVGVSSNKTAGKPGRLRGPLSKRGLALPKPTLNVSPPTEDPPRMTKSPKEQTALVPEPAKPKKIKPMPMSKKRLLGLVVDDDLIIDEENICNVKTEMKSPRVQSPAQNCFMNSFLKRLSMEDPLEGTSKQHVYKRPQPSQTASEKKSLRNLEKKSYQESPVSDAAATDDDTWHPKMTK